MEYQILIPARSGSKRFPGKNLQLLGGVPLITHTIIFALKSFPRDRVWVNSDDPLILAEATKFGVQTTFRPLDLAGDLTPTADVNEFQVREFERLGIPCDAIILLQATNPLRPAGIIEQTISIFNICNRQSLATFSILNKKFGAIKNNFYEPTNYLPGQRMQDIDPEYFENGLVYITRVETLKKKVIISKDVYPFIVDDAFCHVDIDNPKDILYAEFLLRQEI